MPADRMSFLPRRPAIRLGLVVGLCLGALWSSGAPEGVAQRLAHPVARVAGVPVPMADYSYAGIGAGQGPGGGLVTQEMLPTRVIRARDFGALPDDGRDDIAALQRACDSAGRAGGGIVLLEKGQYDFDLGGPSGRFVWIRYSRVVVRGYGDGTDGTVLVDHQPSPWPDERRKWLAGQRPSFFWAGPISRLLALGPDGLPVLDTARALQEPGRETITERYGPVVASVLAYDADRNRLIIDPTSGAWAGLRVGQRLRFTLIEPREGSSLLAYLTPGMPPDKIAMGTRDTAGASRVKVALWVRVRALPGNGQVELDSPIPVPVRPEWQPRLHAAEGPGGMGDTMLVGVGVEALRMQTRWTGSFVHHRSSVDDNGWDAIHLNRVADSWVRHCMMRSVTAAVAMSDVAGVLVQDCRIIHPADADADFWPAASGPGPHPGVISGHNGFVISGTSTGVLVYRTHAGASLHGYSLSGRTCLTSIVDGHLADGGALDGHGGLPIHTLIDHMTGGTWSPGGSTGSTPPAHGRGLILHRWQPSRWDAYRWRLRPDIINADALPGVALLKIAYPRGAPGPPERITYRGQTLTTRRALRTGQNYRRQRRLLRRAAREGSLYTDIGDWPSWWARPSIMDAQRARRGLPPLM